MKNKILLFGFLFLINHLSAFSQAIANVAAADSAYNEKDFVAAVDIYNGVIEENGSSANLLYNLGNAYYQLGDYGNAMVAYMRAYKLDPSIKELNSNIRFLESKIEDANKAELKERRSSVTLDEPTFFQNVYTAIAIDTSSNVWAVLGACLFVAFIICAAIYIFSRNVLARKIGFFGGFSLLGLCIICVVGSFIGAHAFYSQESGVLIPFKTELQTQPGEESGKSNNLVLTKGTKVRIISEETDADGRINWYKIRLNSDFIGWVPADALIVI